MATLAKQTNSFYSKDSEGNEYFFDLKYQEWCIHDGKSILYSVKCKDLIEYLEKNKSKNQMTKQSKKHSILESVANTIIGLVVSYMVQLLVFPLYGIKLSHKTNIQITLIFFIVSFTRSYILRRVFNKLHK